MAKLQAGVNADGAAVRGAQQKFFSKISENICNQAGIALGSVVCQRALGSKQDAVRVIADNTGMLAVKIIRAADQGTAARKLFTVQRSLITTEGFCTPPAADFPTAVRQSSDMGTRRRKLLLFPHPGAPSRRERPLRPQIR